MTRALRRIGLTDYQEELARVQVALWLDDDGNILVQVEKPKAVEMARPLTLGRAPAKKGRSA